MLPETYCQAFLLFLTFGLGSFDDIIERTLNYGEKIVIPCPQKYYKDKPVVGFNECNILLEGEDISLMPKCPFRGENLEAFRYNLTVTFNPVLHSGDWWCYEQNKTTYRLTGYGFDKEYLYHNITANQEGADLHLHCHFDNFYPDICKNQNSKDCNNSLKWFRGGSVVEAGVSLQSRNDSVVFPGFYTAISELVLKDTNKQKLKTEDSPYQCIFRNFVGNESTQKYPSSGHAINIEIYVVLCALAVIFFL